MNQWGGAVQQEGRALKAHQMTFYGFIEETWAAFKWKLFVPNSCVKSYRSRSSALKIQCVYIGVI